MINPNVEGAEMLAEPGNMYVGVLNMSMNIPSN